MHSRVPDLRFVDQDVTQNVDRESRIWQMTRQRILMKISSQWIERGFKTRGIDARVICPSIHVGEAPGPYLIFRVFARGHVGFGIVISQNGVVGVLEGSGQI
jgi:hypothetical protein